MGTHAVCFEQLSMMYIAYLSLPCIDACRLRNAYQLHYSTKKIYTNQAMLMFILFLLCPACTWAIQSQYNNSCEDTEYQLSTASTALGETVSFACDKNVTCINYVWRSFQSHDEIHDIWEDSCKRSNTSIMCHDEWNVLNILHTSVIYDNPMEYYQCICDEGNHTAFLNCHRLFLVCQVEVLFGDLLLVSRLKYWIWNDLLIAVDDFTNFCNESYSYIRDKMWRKTCIVVKNLMKTGIHISVWINQIEEEDYELLYCLPLPFQHILHMYHTVSHSDIIV